MAFDTAELKNAVRTTLLLAGRDKAVVEANLDVVVSLGKKEFWKASNWSFARKSITFSLAASASTGQALADDVDGVIGVVRLSTNDNGMKISLITEDQFDSMFPNLAEVASSETVFAKVVSDDGVKKMFFSPPSSAAVTIGYVYKMIYKETTFDKVVPTDYASFVRDCCFYGAYVTDAQGMRLIDFGEWRARLIEAMKRDRIHNATAGVLVPQSFSSVSRNSWRFAIEGYDYHGML